MIFCTLFNQYYLTRGLALYHSLSAVCSEFKLYVFAFDEPTYVYLKSLNQDNLIPISLQEFEDPELLRVKPTRSFAEYCWTSTSSTILWVLQHTEAKACTYIDADMFFYNNPQLLLDEMKPTESVLITAHNYTPQYDQSALSGKYCVQFMHFKKDTNGLKVLNWWRDRCIEWCFNRHEDGKFGDQKYLDNWTSQFEGVHDMYHKGLLAPWNVQQYALIPSPLPEIKVIKTNETFPVIFFHFHGVKYYANNKFIYAPRSYRLSQAIRKYFYEPYCAELKALQKSLPFDGMGTQTKQNFLKDKWLKGHISNIKRNWLKY